MYYGTTVDSQTSRRMLMLRPLPRAGAPPGRDPLVTHSARGCVRHISEVYFCSRQLRSVRYTAQKRLERYSSHCPCANSNLPARDPYSQADRSRRRGHRKVRARCPPALTLRASQAKCERSQEANGSPARSGRQHSSIPRGVVVLVRALGGGHRG